MIKKHDDHIKHSKRDMAILTIMSTGMRTSELLSMKPVCTKKWNDPDTTLKYLLTPHSEFQKSYNQIMTETNQTD